MTRRGLLALLPGLAVIPWLKPKATAKGYRWVTINGVGWSDHGTHAVWRSVDGGPPILMSHSKNITFDGGVMHVRG